MTNIKEEVLKELTNDFSEDLDWGNVVLKIIIDSEPAVNRAIDLTQQKMIKEFKEKENQWLKERGRMAKLLFEKGVTSW